MSWQRQAHIFSAQGQHDLMYSHAQIPAPLKLTDHTYRIFFSSRSTDGKTYPYFLDYDFTTNKILYLETAPLFRHGAPGCFDDSGIMPACAVHHEGQIYLYYIGWNVRKSVPYHLSIGLAVSRDGGRTFDKYAAGPIMDRSMDEPFFNTAPCVIRDGELFRMWYVSATGWKDVNGALEPVYLIRYAESLDGLDWKRHSVPAIDYKFDGEAIGRPWVIKGPVGYRMWYSTRGSIDYRRPEGEHYLLGYADSTDGRTWVRKDDQVGIALNSSGWDSEMLEYCSVIQLPDKEVMLYNGNGFGLTGFGYAERELTG